MPDVLFLPCDTRPPTLEYPLQLGKMAGLNVRTPPLEVLNDLNRPGDTARIADWLLEHATTAHAAIITLETLCLGGMIPARRVSDSLEDALARLEVLREVKRLNPEIRLLAYGVIVRVAHDNDPLEEQPYYGEWGKQLRLVSEWTDRVERGADPAKLEEARGAVPQDILEDWLGTRERNHALHHRALEMVADETLEHLCLTLDDTTPYGLAARDRRRLEARAEALGVWGKVDLYPGADEVAAVLLGRVALGDQPAPKVFVRYPSSLSETSVMLYEDRPLGELVKAHLRGAGCVIADSFEAADFVLGVNAPTLKQSHREPDFEVVDTAARHLWMFIETLERDATRKPVVIADVAYANGAESRFTRLMLERLDVTKLYGYGAWNTAGNALGGAIGNGVCAIAATRASNLNRLVLAEANFSRLVDDWLYQTRVRTEVRSALNNPSPFDLGDLKSRAETEIETRMKPLALELFTEHFAPRLPDVTLRWHGSKLAWPRLFTGVFPLEFIEAESVVSGHASRVSR
jgi:Protein of unknown function (DUF4127)